MLMEEMRIGMDNNIILKFYNFKEVTYENKKQ